MAGRHFGAVYRRIEKIFAAGSVAGLSEGELLERFATRGDEAAFEAILARHGPMVLGICRRVLRDPNDVEDAFQATFLVLVRKAASLRRRELLGNWLFGVASRVALRARVVAQRRRAVEEEGNAALDRAEATPDGDREWESGVVVHEEVLRLPEKYRTAVLLCYLEGLTHEEAARQLGWPLGTVKGRLARARELLRKRLTRRGVSLSASAVSAAVAGQAEAAVPAALIQSTIKAALAVAAGRALAAGVVAANVAALTKGVSDAMFLNALKPVVMVLVAGVLATGAGVVAFQGEAAPPGGAARPSPKTTTSESADVAQDTRKREDARLLDAAQRMFDSQWAAYASGRIAVDRIADASRRWLEAELSTTNRPADRTTAYRAHLKRMEKLEAYEYSALPKHQGKDENFTAARFLRLQAEKMVTDTSGSAPGAPAVVDAPRPPAAIPVLAALKAETPVSGGATMDGASSSARFGGVGGRAMSDRDRVEVAKLVPRVATRDKTRETQAVLKALEKPVPLAFPEKAALQDVLKYIQSQTAGADGSTPDREIAIYLDPVALEERKIDPESPLVTIYLEGIPLKTSLRLLLKQLNLAYCVRDGVVIISSVEGVLQELKEADAIDEAATVPEPAAPAEARASAPILPPGSPIPPPKEDVAAETPNSEPPEGVQPGVRGLGFWNNMAATSSEVQKTLDAPVKLSIAEETPLGDVFKSIKQLPVPPGGRAIPVHVDPSLEGVTIPGKFELEGAPLRTVLSLLLSQLGIGWDIQDGLLIVGSSQSLANYRRIAAHFSSHLPSGDGIGPSNPTPEVQAKLEMPMTLSFPEPTPLDEVMKQIRDATRGAGTPGISVFYGPPVAIVSKDDLGNQPKADEDRAMRTIGALPVRIDVKDVPLRTCLALLLGQEPPMLVDETRRIGGHAWPPLDGRLSDGVLIIGAGDWVRSIQLHQEGFHLDSGRGPGMGGGAGIR